MRAEVAAIEDPDAARRFARSAAMAAFLRGWGVRLGGALIAAALIAAITFWRRPRPPADGGPGVLGVTVPLPALVLLAVTGVTAAITRSFRIGVETGALSLVLGWAALSAVLAGEGRLWMDRHGVFVLDGDPPKVPVDRSDVVFDLFTSGMCGSGTWPSGFQPSCWGRGRGPARFRQLLRGRGGAAAGEDSTRPAAV